MQESTGGPLQQKCRKLSGERPMQPFLHSASLMHRNHLRLGAGYATVVCKPCLPDYAQSHCSLREVRDGHLQEF